MIGEWNDTIENDIMTLKRDVIDELIPTGINKFILIGENVLNFHGADDCYYEEWYEDVSDEGGWICFVGLLDHVIEEMEEYGIQNYVHLGFQYNIIWRTQKPEIVFESIQHKMDNLDL